MINKIQELILDREATISMYESNKELVKKGLCYNNSIDVLVLKHLSEFQQGIYKVGYGYVGFKDGLLVRHCFIVNEKNKIIDLSAIGDYSMERFKTIEGIVYVVFAQLNATELKTGLMFNDMDTDLRNPLKSNECLVKEYIREKGYKVYETDWDKYLKDL